MNAAAAAALAAELRAGVPVRGLQRHLRKAAWFARRYLLRQQFLTIPVPALGLAVRGYTADYGPRHLYTRGVIEPMLTRFVLENVQLADDDVAFDIGANLGWYALLLSRLAAPSASIFAFEPDPDNFRLLRDNLAANGARQVTAVNSAVGAEPGTLRLYQSHARNRGRHSLLPLEAMAPSVAVSVDSLSGFWHHQALGTRPIRFVKIDVEGYETFVLRGAGRLLARCETLVLEYSPQFMQRAGLEPRELLEVAAAAGLEPWLLRDAQPERTTREALLQLSEQVDLVWKPRR
jgi:FkbM family methyltransferase